MRVVETGNKGTAAMSITLIGLDTAKSVFQIHGVNVTAHPRLMLPNPVCLGQS
jgi:hypothetical protein